MNETVLYQNTSTASEIDTTVTQLVECLNDWTKTLDDHGQTDIIYLDIAKAFDSVPHKKLLIALEKMGITGYCYSWIKAFLANREQYVRVDGMDSCKMPVTSGVPQGSVIAPILFICYINEVTFRCKYSTCKLFADDSKIYIRSDISGNPALLQTDLNNICSWMREWQLKLSIEKCSVLHAARNPTITQYTVENLHLTTASKVKDLGIHISRNLKPALHCQKIAIDAMKISACIFRNFLCRDIDFLKHMYLAFVLPKVSYATVIWSPWLKKDINIIESVQRSYTSKIPGIQGNYSERLCLLSLEPLELRRLHTDLIEVFKIFHGITSLQKSKFFELGNRRTRGHSLKLSKQKFNCDERKFFFSNRIVDSWNILPEEAINATSVENFKQYLKQNSDLSTFLHGGFL